MKPLGVVYMGARQAGCIGLLTLLGARCEVFGVVAYDGQMETLAQMFQLPALRSIHDPSVQGWLRRCDLLVCVHGREIVPQRLLDLPRHGGINVHPCLRSYPGAHPIERLLSNGDRTASVGVHRMTHKVDKGEVLVEEPVELSGQRSVEEVYNALYPSYATALLKAMHLLQRCELP